MNEYLYHSIMVETIVFHQKVHKALKEEEKKTSCYQFEVKRMDIIRTNLDITRYLLIRRSPLELWKFLRHNRFFKQVPSFLIWPVLRYLIPTKKKCFKQNFKNIEEGQRIPVMLLHNCLKSCIFRNSTTKPTKTKSILHEPSTGAQVHSYFFFCM